MPHVKRVLPIALILSATLGGCGLYVPEKDLLIDDNIVPKYPSPQGELEQTIVAHIKCEIRKGVYLAMSLPNVDKWLGTWGATVSLKVVVDEQSGLTRPIHPSAAPEHRSRALPSRRTPGART